MPIVAEQMKKLGCYDTRHIFGVTTFDIVCANTVCTFVAQVAGFDAQEMDVPLTCGHTGTSILPLLSRITPESKTKLSKEQVEALIDRVQFWWCCSLACCVKCVDSSWSDASVESKPSNGIAHAMAANLPWHPPHHHRRQPARGPAAAGMVVGGGYISGQIMVRYRSRAPGCAGVRIRGCAFAAVPAAPPPPAPPAGRVAAAAMAVGRGGAAGGLLLPRAGLHQCSDSNSCRMRKYIDKFRRNISQNISWAVSHGISCEIFRREIRYKIF